MVLTSIGLLQIVVGSFQVRQAMKAGELALEGGDISVAEEALQKAHRGLDVMQKGFPYLSYLKAVPWMGDQLVAGESATLAAQETVEVLLSGLEVGKDIFQAVAGADSVLGGASGEVEARSYGSLNDEEKRALLWSLASALPELREMQVRLRLAQSDLDRLDKYRVSPAVAQAILPLKELIPELLTGIEVLVPFSAIAPQFAGLHEEQQFLILFLNNTELRPAGGFIGVYGLMVTEDGDIKHLTTDDSYNIDRFVEGTDYHVNPPPPLVSWLGQPHWYFRDATWSPDFAQASRDAVQLMRQEIAYGGQPVPEIHGVFGITPTFISRLLDLVGPVTVEDQTFTSENIAETLEYQVEIAYAEEGIHVSQRKEIVSLLTDEVIERILDFPPSSWSDLFHVLHAGFAEKEIALMSFDDKTQAALEDTNWSGVINPAGADDVLMVVDANLAALKTDPVVDRQVEYKIEPHGSGYRATTSITYAHHGSFDWKTTRYRTYTRVYAPLGSKLVTSSGTMKNDKVNDPSGSPGQVIVADELGMTSFGAFIAIEPGETKTLSFTYDLPSTVISAIKRGTYRFLAIKQMGAGDNLLTLDLNFDTTVASAYPPEVPEEFNNDSYRLTTRLVTDQLMTVRLR